MLKMLELAIIVLLLKVLASSAQECTPRTVAVTESSGASFQSPNYPRNYPNQFRCSWSVRGPEGFGLQFDVVTFELETSPCNPNCCDWDFLEIIDNGNSLGRFCGTNGPVAVRSQNNAVTVNFRSDDTVAYSGFRIGVTAVRVPQGCGPTTRRVPLIGGISIQSPNFPDLYPNQFTCSWSLTAPQGTTLQFDATAFDVEPYLNDLNTNCLYDYLELLENGASLRRWCAFRGPAGERTTGNTATLNFRSDEAEQRSGFNITVTAISTALCTPSTVNVPASGSVAFQSPNFPNPYPNNFDCSWTVVAPRGSPMQFDVAGFDFNLENDCSYDWFEIVEAGVSLGRFCGSNGPVAVRTRTNSVTARFHSDATVNGRGFNITVKVIQCGLGLGFCPNNESICLTNDKYCNGVNDCPDGDDEACIFGCGIPQVRQILSSGSLRITGGVEANAHSWPWTAQLIIGDDRGRGFCGATIIDHNWVLTSARCVDLDLPPAAPKILIGAHNTSRTSEPNSQIIGISRYVFHPNYTRIFDPTRRQSHDNDFCLLRTDRRIVFNRDVVPACLPSATESLEAVGTDCYITGWGATSANSERSPVLRQAFVEISDQTACRRIYSDIEPVTPRMICARGNAQNACYGDEGGPLVCRRSASDPYRLIGLASFGPASCSGGSTPYVYSRVSSVLTWINETMHSN